MPEQYILSLTPTEWVPMLEAMLKHEDTAEYAKKALDRFQVLIPVSDLASRSEASL